MIMKIKSLIAGLLLAAPALTVSAQDQFIIDRVVAVVGDFNILQSDIEQQYLQMKAQGMKMPDDARCQILQMFIEQKLMLNQAKIDSIEVSPSQVEIQLDSRLDYFLSQFTSDQEMEEYFGKSLLEIKDDLRDVIREQMITNQVQQQLTGDIRITPSEVRSYFKKIPADSIPQINTQVEISQIVAYPPYSEEAMFAVREKLLELRKRVMDGENFATLAILYSEDPGSAPKGGEIGFMSRGELDPAYATAAWGLKEGQVSKIVESEFGFHIIQCIARRNDRVNTRHILMKPKADVNARQKALSKLDSLRTVILNDSMTFDLAAKYYSEDKNTSVNGGLVVNPRTNSALFELDQLDVKDYYVIRNMNVGDLSEPYETTDENGKPCYKIIRLQNRIEPHPADLKTDYLLLQNLALEKKQQDILHQWYLKKLRTTYLKIDPAFNTCENIQSELNASK